MAFFVGLNRIESSTKVVYISEAGIKIQDARARRGLICFLETAE